MTINQYLEKIKTALKGEEVRGSIYESIKKLYEDINDLEAESLKIQKEIEELKEKNAGIAAGGNVDVYLDDEGNIVIDIMSYENKPSSSMSMETGGGITLSGEETSMSMTTNGTITVI